MKAVFTQAVVGALDDIVQHTRRAGGERSGEPGLLQRLRKQLPRSTQPPPSFRLLSHFVCMYVWKHVCTWGTLFFSILLLSLLRVSSGRCVTALWRFCCCFWRFWCVLFFFFFLNTNSMLAGSFTYKLTLSEIGGSMKFKLLYHSWGTMLLVLLFSISFKKWGKHNSNVCRVSLIKMID